MNGRDMGTFIVQYGTNAERLALDSNGIKPLTAFYETDTTLEYKWFGSWVAYPGAASGRSSLTKAQIVMLNNLAVNSIAPSLSESYYSEQWLIKRRIAKAMAAIDIDISPTHFFDPSATSSAGTGTKANPFHTTAQVQSFFTGDMKQVTLGFKRGTKVYGGMSLVARGGINYPARIIPYGNSEYAPELIGGQIADTWSNVGSGVWAMVVAANQDVYQNGYRLLKKSATYSNQASAIAGLVAGGPGTMGYVPSLTAVYILPIDGENPNLGQIEITNAEYGLNFLLQADQQYSGNVLISGLHIRLGRNNALGWSASGGSNIQQGISIDRCICGQSGVDQIGGYLSSAAISMNGLSLTSPLKDWAVTNCFIYDALNNAVEQLYTDGGQVSGNTSYNIGGNSIFEAYLGSKNNEIAYNIGYSDMQTPLRLSVGSYSYGGFAMFGLTTGAVADSNSTANINNWVHHNLIVNPLNAFSMSGGANTTIEHNTIMYDRPKTSAGTTTVVRGIAAASGMTGISWSFNRNLIGNVDSTTVGKFFDLQAGSNAFPNPNTSDYNAYMMAASFRGFSGSQVSVLRNAGGTTASWIGLVGLDNNSVGTHDTDSNQPLNTQGNWSVMDVKFKTGSRHPVLTAPRGPNLGYIRDIDGLPIGDTPIAGCYAAPSVLATYGYSRVRNLPVSATAALQDDIVLIDATAGAVTYTLPPSSTAFNNSSGFKVTVKKTDASSNTVTILCQGSDKVDGASSIVLSSQYDVARVQAVSSVAASAFISV